MQTKIRGIDRVSGDEIDIYAGNRHDLYVSELLPKYSHLVLQGAGAIVQATTAVATVVADPTTASLGTLYNGETGGGKVYIIDQVFFDIWKIDTSHIGWVHMVGCIQPVGVITTHVADITIRTRLGDAYGGSGIFDVGHTVVDHGWFPISNSVEAGPSTNEYGGHCVIQNVEGRICLKPTAALGTSVISDDTDVTTMVGVAWFEVDVDYS